MQLEEEKKLQQRGHEPEDVVDVAPPPGLLRPLLGGQLAGHRAVERVVVAQQVVQVPAEGQQHHKAARNCATKTGSQYRISCDWRKGTGSSQNICGRVVSRQKTGCSRRRIQQKRGRETGGKKSLATHVVLRGRNMTGNDRKKKITIPIFVPHKGCPCKTLQHYDNDVECNYLNNSNHQFSIHFRYM